MEYYQSNKFAVPVRDYSEVLIDETILSLDKQQQFIFLKPKMFAGLTVLDVSEQINNVINSIEGKNFKVLISGKRDVLSTAIQFERAPALCWKAELVIVGLR